MESIEENNSMLSDMTFIAYEVFMKNILPEIFVAVLKKPSKEVVITVENKDEGIFINNHNLGRINYQEFVNYLYGLNSCISFKLDVRLIKNKVNLLFSFKELIKDYNDFLQADEYINHKDENTEISKTDQAIENFKENILPSIIKDAFNDGCELTQIFDDEGRNIANFLYLPIEIRYKNLYIGEYDIGEVNILNFLNNLKTMSFYNGLNQSSDMVIFDLNKLVSLYNNSITR